MYVYIKSEPQLWTVGFYTPSGEWMPESDWTGKDEAANRVHWLNGGNDVELDELRKRIEELEETEEQRSADEAMEFTAKLYSVPA